jgi:hypothetical protein
VYQLSVEALVDLASQAADMHLDDGRTGIEVEVPDVLQKHRARDDLELCVNLGDDDLREAAYRGG